ncbi:disulfide bond formation protein B [Acidisoma cellulosilytica]|uniref:Disulfide bond formation protein B n=1 Tax=Acidisoma cellulosilyticum TaxID=2802395 RepID=A0A963Z0T9_9PROT|nr:disulfide bond formation protein B [Acidisoma cellulosilyticum]MCB8880777.1 disulfide bond formation protein B [Acidisoma cellulosilyticum]
MTVSQDRLTAWIILLLGAAALAVAYGSQYGLGMAPCDLCYWERWPYRAAILIGLLALILPRPVRRFLLWLGVLPFLANIGIAGLHVGVERGFWPSPLPECSAANIFKGSLSTLMSGLPATPAKPCDAPNFLIPGLPISFTTMDLIYAAICSAIVVFCLTRRRA